MEQAAGRTPGSGTAVPEDGGPRLAVLSVIAAVAAIEAEFEGWKAWVSDHGHWYAVRQGPQGRYTRGGRTMTLDADDADALRARLAALTELELAAAS